MVKPKKTRKKTRKSSKKPSTSIYIECRWVLNGLQIYASVVDYPWLRQTGVFISNEQLKDRSPLEFKKQSSSTLK